MQLLCFTVGDDSYAIPSRHVVEVIPLMEPRPLPHAPAAVRGVFMHRGRLTPLVDLSCLLGREPLRDRLSTRVIVVEPAATTPGRRVRLGVAAEQVLSLCDGTAADDRLPPVAGLAAPCLGACLRLDGRTIQCIDVERLLPPEVWSGLAGADDKAADGRAAASGGRRP
jgi:chemotaxis-related protein WspB